MLATSCLVPWDGGGGQVGGLGQVDGDGMVGQSSQSGHVGGGGGGGHVPLDSRIVPTNVISNITTHLEHHMHMHYSSPIVM